VELAAPGNRFRAFALFTGAAVAVHQLRYLLAYGGHSQGHSYLELVIPLAVALVLLAIVAFAVRLMSVRASASTAGTLPGGRGLWMRCTAILFVVYGFQEGAEGNAVFARGGWFAIPLALLFGALVAWLLKGAETAIVVVTSRRRSRRRTATSPVSARRERPRQKPALDVLAGFLASRGPPVTSV
jgi:hypothetical protein